MTGWRNHSHPEVRRKSSERFKALTADPSYRASRGWLTAEQEAIILTEILAGRRRADIADEWLVEEITIHRIAAKRGIVKHPGRTGRPKKCHA